MDTIVWENEYESRPQLEKSTMPTESDPNTTPSPASWAGLLRCHACGNTVECKAADLLRFTRTKWLQCCGEVMALYEPVPKPGEMKPPGA
jgi:hypothetical protein